MDAIEKFINSNITWGSYLRFTAVPILMYCIVCGIEWIWMKARGMKTIRSRTMRVNEIK